MILADLLLLALLLAATLLCWDMLLAASLSCWDMVQSVMLLLVLQDEEESMQVAAIVRNNVAWLLPVEVVPLLAQLHGVVADGAMQVQPDAACSRSLLGQGLHARCGAW